MKDIDFSNARRGALISEPGKERITIRLDSTVLAWFRDQVKGGGNYQTLINNVLKAHIGNANDKLERTLRKVIREELRAAH